MIVVAFLSIRQKFGDRNPRLFHFLLEKIDRENIAMKAEDVGRRGKKTTREKRERNMGGVAISPG